MFVNWLYNRDMYPTLVRHISNAIEQERYLLPNRSQGLAKAFKEFPNLFSPYYADVVYHGDNAGLLDATLRRLAELLQIQWRLAGARPAGEEPVLLFLPASSPQASEWNGLTAYQQHATLILLMRGFATALACGVPILAAMRLMAPLLPETAAAHWMEAIEDIKKGDPIIHSLRRMEILPEYAIQLISIGEELGTLDSTLMRAAELMEDENASTPP
jgi:type II secretory pathway component PulF